MKLVKKINKNSGNEGKLVVARECRRSSGAGYSCGEVRKVVVGVRLDQQSIELLTWTLVNVAKTGDHVIALHVLHSSFEEQSALISLVKTFDSVLSVYEGFCHLKQVDLKLKVCRGSSLRKILVREAKAFGSATLILGTRKAQHKIRSPTSVAKYCARKLPDKFAVFAVDNGKVVFQRAAASLVSGNCKKASNLNDEPKVDNQEVAGRNSAIALLESDMGSCDNFEMHCSGARKSTSLIQRYFRCAPISAWAEYPCDEIEGESPVDDREDYSLALVPYQTPEPSPGPKLTMNQEVRESRRGWPLLRRAFLRKHPEADKFPCQKMSIFRRVLKLSERHSSIAVHLDRKKHSCSQTDDQVSDLSSKSGAIVLVGDVAAFSPCSTAHQSIPKELQGLHEKFSSNCRLFTYLEIQSATSNFATEKVIGKGGSSQVYRGCLPDGKELAVKILKPSEDVLQEFITEIEVITSVSHNNIISLFGFCLEDENLILVYDFLPRGSLEQNLHGDKNDLRSFGLEERYKVAVGVAEALNYLHNRESQSVVHRDIKSSNILLSDEFEPQVADFGLATWASSASSYSVASDVAGTFGYLAPDYFMHGKVTDKMDVYAFGVVLLELLSGRKPIDRKNPKGKESLVMWANSILKEKKMSQILDPRLGSDYDHDQVERMVLAATLCIRREPQLRPRMGNVLKLLQGDAEVFNWAKQQVNSYPVDFDALDVETSPTDIQSHLNMALLDIVEDDSLSESSTEQNISIEDYLKGRWSRSSSFD